MLILSNIALLLLEELYFFIIKELQLFINFSVYFVTAPFLSRHFLPVLQGRETGMLAEDAAEVRTRRVSQIVGNQSNDFGAVGKQLTGSFHLDSVDIVAEIFPELLFETGGKIAARHVEMAGNLLCGNRFGNMMHDVVIDLGTQRGILCHFFLSADFFGVALHHTVIQM